MDAKNPSVTSVTSVTASNNRASIGNTRKAESVTSVTGQILGAAIDPSETPLEGIPDIYPFPRPDERPCWEVYDDWCGPNNAKRAGVYFHGMTAGSEQVPPQMIDDWVCDPLHVDATTRDRGGASFGMMLRFRDKLGTEKQWNMPARLLAGRGSDGLLQELFDQGLQTNYDKRGRIPAYINSRTPKRDMWAAAQVGWHESAFVLPHRVVGDGGGEVFFQSETATQREYATRGTLEEWRERVAAKCVGNTMLIFQVSAAFAGPLLKLANMDGAGFHFFGSSSCGKSTGGKLSASVWGDFKSYMRTWKATANGLEGAACLFNDGLLILDELNDGAAKEIDQAIYALGNGKGKQRATVTGGARSVRTWRILTMSNGEKTIEAHLAACGLSAKAGQLMRLLQVPVFGKFGAFDDLHGAKDGGAFSATLTDAAGMVYGTAGVEFLEHLTEAVMAGEDIAKDVRGLTHHITSHELSSQEGRAASAFALVATAGELAAKWGITGWPEGMAMEAAQACFSHWREHRGAGDAEASQILRMLSDHISIYGDSRFTSVNDDRILHGPRSGYWRDSERGREWLLTPAGMRDAIKGFDTKRITSALRSEGWLLPGADKAQQQVKVQGKNGRYYVICLPEGGD